MNRRILLIDSDLAFRTTLTVVVQKYRIDVVHEPDADEAIALGATHPPELIVVGVEEPEKAGFKIFQRLKKGPLSKVPVMLVTGSVPADSFAKHKSLKTHADEYLDKRGLTKDALAEKIVALLGLSDDEIDGDLDIPVEVDDINMGDGGAVIDEEAPPEGDEFNEQKTRMGGPNAVDAEVAEDVDDAFAGLMGFGGEDVPSLDSVKPTRAATPSPPAERGIAATIRRPTTPAPIAPQAAATEVEGERDEFDDMPQTRADHQATVAALRTEKLTSPNPMPVVMRRDDEVSVVDAIPGAIHDAGRREEDFDDVRDEKPAPYPMEDVLASKDMIPVEDMAKEEPVDQAKETLARPAALESSPAIPLDADDVELLSDGDLVEEDSGGVPEPVPHPRSAEDAAAAAAAREAEKSKPRVAAVSSPSIDLGLDKIADDARQEQESGGYAAVRAGSESERDQSGVYDRRALRKIGELERQIAQLKTELERSRATAEAAAKGGGREQTFLNLREKMMAADNELKKVRGDLSTRDKELADANARLLQEREQRQALEDKARELEQKYSAEAAKAASATREHQAQASTIAELEKELGEKTDALRDLDAARSKLESELASERAMRAASASDAERQLRVEREQLVARHQGELQTLKQDLQARHEAALEALRTELAQAQAGAVAAAIEATRNEVGGEAEDAIAQLEAQRDQDIATLRQEHQWQVSKLTSDHQAALTKLTNDHQSAIAKLTSERDDAIARVGRERDDAVARVQSELQLQIDEAKRALESANAAHERAIAEQAAAHGSELAEQANQHAAAMQARERELMQARQDEAIKHTAAIAELKAELDKMIAKHGSDMDGAKRELEELMALHEQNKAQIADEQKAAQARIAQEHADEIERLQADKQRAIDDIARAAQEAKAQAERVAEQHRQELAAQREAADREVAELRQMLVGAKRQMEEAAAAARAEREQLEKQHEQALAEQVAQHERAMAMANGEIVKVKAVADSERTRELAAAKAAHDSAMKELESNLTARLDEATTERDELKRGLSAARDTIKRSEGELATAVQTIADRNAELRSASAAINERDERIAQLRKEIEAIEQENANYQEQVLRAYQKIKSDEAMVARAKKAMAIALTVLDDQGTPKSEPT